MSSKTTSEPKRREHPSQSSTVAKDVHKHVNETCAMCAQSCKQGPECVVVACRHFKKEDEDPQ